MSRNHQIIKDDPRWLAARRACLERDSHACIVCGSSEQLEVDHITELQHLDLTSDDGLALAFDVDNLQTLCKPHHGQKAKGLIRSTFISPRYPELLNVF